MAQERRSAGLKQQRSIDTRDALLEAGSVVFARQGYSASRLRDIAMESGVSDGSIYFHFGNKADIALAILESQQARMTEMLATVEASNERGLDKVLALTRKMAELIASDTVVQAGIQLAGDTSLELAKAVSKPYFEWIQIVRTLIEDGIEDGSIRPDVDVDASAELINVVFVGAQVLSGLEDRWTSFPARHERVIHSWLDPLRHDITTRNARAD